jgi:hypothetical protein
MPRMLNFKVDKELFKFVYLPDYASFILKNILTEFITVGIRFSREADLPLLKPLGKLTEKELVELSMESHKEILKALSENKIGEYIEVHAKKWISNSIGIIDKDDIVAEDLTLVFYLRRKLFAHFLDQYTKNVVEQKYIIAELDFYTTHEELLSYNIYLKMQQEKLLQLNKELVFHKELLIEAQDLSGVGSFALNFKDQSKSVFTPGYKRILEINDVISFDSFLECVNVDDREKLLSGINTAYKTGGSYEVEYRYKKSVKEKKIWSKGFILTEEGKPVFIRGIIKEVA